MRRRPAPALRPAPCLALALLLGACGSPDEGSSEAWPAETPCHAGAGGQPLIVLPEAGDRWPDLTEETTSPCPPDMARVAETCIDRYEAPGRAGALPLVMYSFHDAAAWCAQRGKRLCYDDEWTRACEGAEGWPLPYGARHEPGRCRDDARWRAFDQDRLDLWPLRAASPAHESLAELFDAAQALGGRGLQAVQHVQALYQALPSGAREGCRGSAGVLDLVGNVEEWVRRRHPGGDYVSGLKGRYWAETASCQATVTVHAPSFRFYEIGFRCCSDPR